MLFCHLSIFDIYVSAFWDDEWANSFVFHVSKDTRACWISPLSLSGAHVAFHPFLTLMNHVPMEVKTCKCVQEEWKLARCWNYKRKKATRKTDSVTCSGWCPCPDHTARSHDHVLQFIGSLPMSEEESKDAKDLLPSPKQIQTHQACNWAQRTDLCSCQSHVAICPPFQAVPCCHLSPRQPGRSGPSVSAWPVPWGQLSRPFPGWFSHTPCLEVQIPTSHG